MLLENWKTMEDQIGDHAMMEKVKNKLPKRVKKQRRIKIADGDLEEDGGK